MPNKKADLLTRYRETCHRGDQTAPTLPSALASEETSSAEEFSPLHDEDDEPLLLEAFPSHGKC
jgi:hypothetical protein